MLLTLFSKLAEVGKYDTGRFFKLPQPPLFSSKMPTSQPELLFHESLHMREPLVGPVCIIRSNDYAEYDGDDDGRQGQEWFG